MTEGQGEALATIAEIARGHGDIRPAIRAARRTPLERLLAGWRSEANEFAEERPYSAVAVALAVGFLGGIAIAAGSRRGHHPRGW